MDDNIWLEREALRVCATSVLVDSIVINMYRACSNIFFFGSSYSRLGLVDREVYVFACFVVP